MSNDPAPKESFDHTKPLTTTRSFMGGNRRFKMNERFDPEKERCSPERTEELYDAGYLRYGDPRPRVPKAERDRRKAETAKAQAVEYDMTRSNFAAVAKANRERKQAAEARVRKQEPAQPFIPEQNPPNVTKDVPRTHLAAPQNAGGANLSKEEEQGLYGTGGENASPPKGETGPVEPDEDEEDDIDVSGDGTPA